MTAHFTVAAVAVAGLVGALSIAEPQPQHTAPTHQTCEKRMPHWQSQAIKREMADAAGVRMQDVELDHIQPLCLCGTNDRSNLQLQPWPEARRKDEVEIALCRAVSHGELSREEAVRRILAWRP